MELKTRARRAARQGTRVATAGGRKAVAVAKATVPEPIKSRLYPVLPWRPGTAEIAVDRLQLGVMGPQTAAEYAAATGDLLWPSTLVVDGPHLALLRQADGAGTELSDDDILASPYAAMARRCLEHHGRFFWAGDDGGIVEVARDFVDRARGRASTGAPRAHQSPAGSPIRLAPIRWSGQYQVIDGHHRIAIAAHRGDATVTAKVKWLAVTTPFQDLLNEMSWIGGERELYQPIEAPELRPGWTTVRRCTDRLTKMQALLAERGVGEGASYLDVACCYGWFPSRLLAAGFDAHGIERDPLSRPLAQAVYGLDPGRIEIGDAVEALRGAGRTYDVVSCFSLLHHFALGRASVGADDLLRLLDDVTGRVLFLDTGQDDEAWFAESLRGWDPASIRERLLRVTSFDEVVDLGPDADRVPPYADNYGRHLFACIRH
jgi:hypothetical protein